MSKHFPVCIAYTTSHGWQAIYEQAHDFLGKRFECVLWLREPSKKLAAAMDASNAQTIKLGQNILAPGLVEKIKNVNIDFAL